MAKRAKTLQDILQPGLQRLGAKLVEEAPNETFDYVNQEWHLATGAGRLRVWPGNVVRSKYAARGHRGRLPAFIHSRFDDPYLGGRIIGDPDNALVHNGKWNFYADSPTEESTRYLVDYFLIQLERAVAWQPTAHDWAVAEEWKRRHDERWRRLANKTQ